MLRSIKKIQLLLRAFILLRIYLQIYLPLQYFESNLELSISIQIRYIFRKEFILKGSLILELFVSSKSYEETYFSLTISSIGPISRDLIKPLQTPKRPILHKLPRNISNPRTTFYEETISHNPANIEPLDTPQTSQTSRLPTQPL